MTQLMINLLCVGAGGFIGAMIRAATGLWISKLTLFTGFPYATLFVNLTGCFLIGLLGGLTTFSTFTADNLNMLMHRDLFRALINMGVSLGLGLICCAAGVMLSRALVSKI